MKKLPKRVWVVAELFPDGDGPADHELWASESKREVLGFLDGLTEIEKLGPVLYERVDKPTQKKVS